jgi:ataxia telangiectasia mutated family protein
VDGLSLECLRLELAEPDAGNGGAFVARTFRAGSNFDAVQALSWAILELQSDCAEKVVLFYRPMNNVLISFAAV